MAEEAGDAFDKLKAGAKAVAKKVTDPNRDLGTEYDKDLTSFQMKFVLLYYHKIIDCQL